MHEIFQQIKTHTFDKIMMYFFAERRLSRVHTIALSGIPESDLIVHFMPETNRVCLHIIEYCKLGKGPDYHFAMKMLHSGH